MKTTMTGAYDNPPPPKGLITPPPSSGGGWALRPLLPSDAGDWHSVVARSCDEILRWEDWPEALASEEATKTLLERLAKEWRAGRSFYCGVHAGDRLVGGVTIANVLWDCRCADLGYWVATEHRGQGVAVWAARRMIDYGFYVLKLQRIQMVIRADHLASHRVAEKLGAGFEGLARKRIVHRGRAIDAKVYAITRDET
jgi:ribosomal-protein-serine acetyltransferase